MVSVVRGVTTRTKTGEAAGHLAGADHHPHRGRRDPTVRGACVPGSAGPRTPSRAGAIRSQVVLELENKLAREIITGYGEVSVEADADNPRCAWWISPLPWPMGSTRSG